MSTFHTQNDRLKNFSTEYTLHHIPFISKILKKIHFLLTNIYL